MEFRVGPDLGFAVDEGEALGSGALAGTTGTIVPTVVYKGDGEFRANAGAFAKRYGHIIRLRKATADRPCGTLRDVIEMVVLD